MTRDNPPCCPLTDAEMWRAIETRSVEHDDQFWFAVRTTGIYCRPSCAARRPLRANVVFYASPAAAEAAGYRACHRCSPRGISPRAMSTARIAAVCRRIEQAEEPPHLTELAAVAGLAPHHLHRRFKALTGVTPTAYAREVRNRRVRESLKSDATVTEAVHQAGFNGNARFYATATEVLGMRVESYRGGGDDLAIRYAVAGSTIGQVLVAATDTGVCAILLGDDADELQRDLTRRFPRAAISSADESFAAVVAMTIALIEEPIGAQALPLDIRGTAFQQRVWQALRAIPCGTTITYAQLAARIGQPKAVRAVARACGANAIAIAVPCHRVVGSDGSLTGYRWGIERKRRLLDREAAPQNEMASKKPVRRG